MKNLNSIILKEIKSKSQIESLEDDFIKEKLEKFFLTNGNIRKKLEIEYKSKEDKILKSKTFKEVIKKIREEIGVVYGSFLTQDFSKKEKLLQKDISEEKMLKLHKSTRERLDFYDEIYEKIFNWYKPLKIADLACGLNPLSYPFIEKKLGYKPKYFASDLNPKDMEFLNTYFEKNNLPATAKSFDIVNLEILNYKCFQNADLIFLFKALDSLEFVKKNISKELIKKTPANHIVVSFPTKSLLSKKEFKTEKRNWFINFLNKENYKYETFEIENEMFFLIEKATKNF